MKPYKTHCEAVKFLSWLFMCCPCQSQRSPYREDRVGLRHWSVAGKPEAIRVFVASSCVKLPKSECRLIEVEDEVEIEERCTAVALRTM